MKRLSLMAVILVAAVIGLVPALGQAGQTSFFDTGSIIRVYSAGAQSPYNLNIEAVDTSNQHLSGASFTCNGTGAVPGNPAVVATDCDDDSNISMAFDADQGKAYVFYGTASQKLVTCSLSGITPPPPPPPSGSPDLTITSTPNAVCPGYPYACPANNVNFNMTATVKNQGTGAAGAFTVKGFIQLCGVTCTTPAPTSVGGTELFSWSLSGLAAGASQTQTFPGRFSGLSIHNWYWLCLMADSEKVVAESNETNNVKCRQVQMFR